MKRIFIIVVSLFLYSCASLDGPAYETVEMNIPEGKGRIVVYRIWSGTGAVWPADFYLDGTKISSLDNGGFNYIYVEPGQYTVSHGPEQNPYHKKVAVIVKAGRSYFVGLQRGMPDDISLSENSEPLKGFKLQVYNP